MVETNDDVFDFDWYPQVTQHPHTIVEGEVDDIVSPDVSDAEQTGSNFGVTFADAVVEKGEIWKNDSIPEGFVSTSQFNDYLELAVEEPDYMRGMEVDDEMVEAATEAVEAVVGDIPDDVSDESVGGTDYKIVDPDDEDTEPSFDRDGNEKGVDVGGGTFNSVTVDSFDTDNVMVWYGGIAGQFVGRAMDFNGLPWARFTKPDDGEQPYLIKGLFQPAKGWRGSADADFYDNVETTDKSKLAKSEDRGGLGRSPRTVRRPHVRPDIDGERLFISISRFNGGAMREANIGYALDDYEAFVEAMNARDSSYDDIELDGYDEVGLRYSDDADEELDEFFDQPADELYQWYSGEGWQDEPDEWGGSADGNDGGGFEMGDGDDDSGVDHPTEQEERFAQMVSEKMAGREASLDDEDAFEVDGETYDLAGLVELNDDAFDVDPSVEAIRDEIDV